MYLYLYLKNLLHSEEGQDLIEYALIMVLIVLAVAVALPGVATAINAVFTRIYTNCSDGARLTLAHRASRWGHGATCQACHRPRAASEFLVASPSCSAPCWVFFWQSLAAV